MLHFHKNRGMFPYSVCAASSASLIDTCQEDAQTLACQTPQICVTSDTFGTLRSLLCLTHFCPEAACAACRHATKQTERTLLRSKPYAKIKISHTLYILIYIVSDEFGCPHKHLLNQSNLDGRFFLETCSNPVNEFS